MPTRAEVADAGALTEDDVSYLLPYLKASNLWTQYAGQFPTLEADLAALVAEGEDSFKGRFIRATIAGLEAKGDAQLSLAGGREALYFELNEQREYLYRLIIQLLYDISLAVNADTATTQPEVGQMNACRFCLVCTSAPCICGRYCY